MPENQHVVFLSDGGEGIRQALQFLHPGGEHWLDWVPITMRWSVLNQQTKAVSHGRPIPPRLSRHRHQAGVRRVRRRRLIVR